MKLIKESIKLWNKNFDKGITIFQLTLGISMFVFAFSNNQYAQESILLSTFIFLMGYFESTNLRFALR